MSQSTKRYKRLTPFNEIKKGDIVADITFLKVKSIGDTFFGDSIQVTNLDNGMDFEIRGKELIETVQSADRYNLTQPVTRTEMAEILSRSYNTVFTVKFEKTDGTQRTLRGRLIDSEPLMGRVKVEDLDIQGDNRFRLVDNRTLSELIVGGTQYVLKK